MKCPGCGENNDAGMHFCISCGHALTAQGVAAHASQHTEEIAIPPGGSVVLFCPLCKKADPLNGQFCVYCAGRTVPMPMQTPMTASPTPSSSTPAFVPSNSYSNLGTVDNRSSGNEVSRITAQQPKTANNLLTTVVAAILGAGVAAATVFIAKPSIEQSALASLWPSDGVIVLSSEPNVDVKIENTKKDSLILGKTAADGSFQTQSISPGKYLLTLSNKTKSFARVFEAKAGQANVIGYPDRLKFN